MSFDLSTTYERALLRPLVLPPTDINATNESANLSEEPQWRTSTHIFRGTDDRDETAAWPPANFSDNPSNIPNDEAYNIPYNSASKKANSSELQLHANSEKSRTSNFPPPKLVAKRYIPTNQVNKSKQGITLLTLTGMGVPKEMFQPMLEDLLPRLRKSGVKVEEIWAVDMPLSGQTAKANPVGYLYANEKDIVRDLLLFLTAYLPVQPGEELPENLEPRKPTAQAQQPTRQNLHVFAHSLGAQAAILASVHAPNIFRSLMVVDPAMIPAGKINSAMTKLPKEIFCLGLKQHFSDHKAVETALRENKRTRNWDERAIQAFTQHGIVPNEKGGVKLIAHPRLDWALWYDKQTPAECYDRFTDISVPLLAIMPKRPFAVPAKMFEADVGKLKGRVDVRWVEGTHQVVYERMDDCVGFVEEWLGDIAGEKRAKL
ncbi:alpha beta hydrolase family domain-containing protein [Fusarium denticulatum]|uniref:Alpha beta hydrolase family domain-containing protein n=1 Tax=Fusarium denticulatum TaxID=48507 RepID=A0A8H5TBK5_9HYPO|nr:alpha beta hydrolase family domain-containing protein [Fusarium denticulatum]